MAMTTQTKHSVHSLLIPLQGDNLLLPCAAVAEIVPFTRPLAVADAPPWLLGTIAWRGCTLALTSVEAVQGRALPVDYGQIAVINAQSGHPDLGFYAIAIAAIPRLIRVDAKAITEQERAADESPLVLSRVLVKGEPAVIPDLLMVEDLVRRTVQHWDAAVA